MTGPNLVPLPRQPSELPWPTVEWPQAEIDPRVDRARLARALDEALAQPEALGRTNAVVVVHRGAIVAERYGDEMGPDTTHISWSMAKSILHALVGVLVRDGRLRVRSPADVPEWADPADPRHAITVDQLLRMSSGLHFVEDYVDDGVSNVIEMLFGSGKADVAAYAASLDLDHAPGSVWSYSSGTSNIIARLVGQAIGGGEKGLWDHLERELFGPLGMKSATLRFDDAATWIGSSFVFATARDFARFGLLYLRDGVFGGRRVLPPGWVDYARTPTYRSDIESYGAHWWLVPGSLGIFQAQGYNGQRTTVVPGLDLVVVRLGVTDVSLKPNLDAFMKTVIDAFRPAGTGEGSAG